MIAVQRLIDDMKKVFGSFFSTEGHAPADMLNYINSGVRLVSNQRDWGFNQTKLDITTTVADELVAIREPISIYHVLDANKTPIKIYDFADYFAQPATEPNVYCGIWDNTFTINVPGTYTLIYSAYPVAVTAPTDNIAFPDSTYDMVKFACMSFGYLDVKDEDNANINLKMMQDLLPPIASRKSNNTPNQPTRMGSKHSF